MKEAELIAALYVEPDGVYADMPGADCWPEERDARRYAGPVALERHGYEKAGLVMLGSGRKVGVGFNYLRVHKRNHGRGWRMTYRLASRMVRKPWENNPYRGCVGSSLVATVAAMRKI